MSSEVKIWSTDFMESQNENESLRARIREVEDENQELRAQNLLQNRTIVELRNELMLLRIQMSELADTSTLLRERVRNLAQGAPQRQQQQQQQETEGNAGQVTTPPLMAPPPIPPPIPPPLPSARIRISPRQVGAGEALTTPLGVSLSSPPRHRIKRDYRQGFCRSTRTPYRRFEGSEPGPSSQTPFFSERPNYFVGLKIIPQFQSFVCPSSQTSSYNDSASDSSGSDENPQLLEKPKSRSSDQKPLPLSRDFELFKTVRNFPHQKVRQSILQNYNISLPNTNSKFFFPLPWDRKTRENPTVPSTSGNEVRFFHAPNPSTSEWAQGGNSGTKNISKVSDCIQYTFPTIHEGLHRSGISSVLTNVGGQPSRLRKFKKNIPYLPSGGGGGKTSEEVKKEQKKEEANGVNRKNVEINCSVDPETFPSTADPRSRVPPLGELPSDFEQDGFQADESSNCLTSTDNSLEKICISDSNMKKKN